MGYILIMKVLVVGFGPHGAGLEACEYYMKKGDEVTIIEMRDRSSFGLLPEKLEKEGVKLLFNTPVDDLSKYDVVVKAPAVPLNVKYFICTHGATKSSAGAAAGTRSAARGAASPRERGAREKSPRRA